MARHRVRGSSWPGAEVERKLLVGRRKDISQRQTEPLWGGTKTGQLESPHYLA